MGGRGNAVSNVNIELTNGETIADVYIFGANNGGGGLNIMVDLPNGRAREISLSDVYRLTYPDRAPDGKQPHYVACCNCETMTPCDQP